MIRYANDLYPRDDPKDGDRILRFTESIESEWVTEHNGTGSGRLVIPADGTDAASLDPLGLQYHRIVEIDESVVDGGTLSGFAERVVFGYFDDEGSFPALEARNLKHLPMGGAGVLSYLDRAKMAPHSYISTTTAHMGFDPYDRLWRLFAAGTGSLIGQILWRVIVEAQTFRTGTTDYDHVHMPGQLFASDIHDNDRVDQSAIPAITMTFDRLTDSDGNAWTIEGGEFTAQIGESVLSVTKRLMEMGLYVELDPDTFELSAWEHDNHGRTRTGGAWGTSVVRFQKSTDETIPTGNIFTDLVRTIRAYVPRTTQWAGGKDDIFGAAHAAGDVPWEGFYQTDVADEDALEAIAAEQIRVRDDAADAVRFPSIPLDDPENGYYRPLHDDGVQLGDIVTLHTGTGEWDFDERAIPVSAIGAKLRQGGDWDVFYDLGASYAPTGDRRFDVAPPGLTSGIELCDPRVTGNAPSVLSSDIRTTNSGGAGFNDLHSLIVPEGSTIVAFDSSNSTAELTSILYHPDGDASTAGDATPLTQVVFEDLGADQAHIEMWVLEDAPAHTGGGGGVLRYNYDGSLDKKVYGYAVLDGVTFFATDSAQGTGTSATLSVSADSADLVFGFLGWWNNVGTPTVSTPGGGMAIVEQAVHDGPAGQRDGEGAASTEVGASSVDWTLASSATWAVLAIIFAGTPAHNILEGVSPRASRCDHGHRYHSASEPDANDDETIGFSVGDAWAQLDDMESPTEVVAEWILVDATEGAAVWLPHAGGEAGSPSGSSLTVEEGDGDPSVSDVTTIVFDENDFQVTDDGGGQVTIEFIGDTGSPGGGSTDGYGPYYDPDRPPSSGTGSTTDEFNDESLHSDWAWTTAPGGTVSETQFPGFLHIDGGTDNAATLRYLRRAYAPGAVDFSVAAKVAVTIENGNFSAGMGIALLDSSDAEIWRVEMFSDGTTTAADGHRILATAGGLTATGIGDFIDAPMYLLITRSSANVYNAYASQNGIIWIRVGGSTVATTVAKVAVTYRADTDSTHEEGLIDFIRVFTSITRKIGDTP